MPPHDGGPRALGAGGPGKIHRGLPPSQPMGLPHRGALGAGHTLLETHRQQLASCYRACLELATEMGLSSLAFCCISTEEFHFPPKEAAAIALSTVREFLSSQAAPSSPTVNEAHPLKIIFNAFTPRTPFYTGCCWRLPRVEEQGGFRLLLECLICAVIQRSINGYSYNIGHVPLSALRLHDIMTPQPSTWVDAVILMPAEHTKFLAEFSSIRIQHLFNFCY